MRIGQFAGSAVGLLVLAGTPLAAPPGRWTHAALMPEERTEVAVAALDGRIYVVGGFGGGGAFLEYDTAADQWRAAAVVGERIFVISGGPRPGGSYSRANEVFTP
jgi:hypothetical protein